MTTLQSLNLSGNLIETIPMGFVKKLRSLRVLKLANNRISSVSCPCYRCLFIVVDYQVHHEMLFALQLSEIVKIRNFHDLQSLTVAGNPLCDLSHHRAYIVFHLRTLEQLDGQNITLNERSAANTRFAQG